MANNTLLKPEPEAPAAADDAPWRIGTGLQTIATELTAIGTELQQMLDDNLAPTVGEAIEAVKKQHSRIAILGLPRTGKTSFVNALIQRPNLLPTDVSPWTSVISRLHFAIPGEPQTGALFTFYEQNEWRRLAEESGNLQELAARLIPEQGARGHEPQFVDPQQVTESRLSQYYQRLFGKDRWHDTVTRDVIDRYARLGQDVEEPLAELMPGRYADITKTADLFFDADPFACPATVIDTPGVNDPLFQRDEISLDSVEDADVYVVVMTAQQPLAAGELALLRMLHRAGKQRIVAFINKIDGISGIDRSCNAIISGVREALTREFPNMEIPVIAGSALWANAALDFTAVDVERIWQPDLIGYARATGVLGASEPTALTGHRTISRERLSDVLYACSGMPAMIAAISGMMLNGVPGYWLSQLADTLLAAAESTTNAARKETSALNALLSIRGENVATPPLMPQKPDNSPLIERLRQVIAHVQDYQQTAEDWLSQETTATVNALHAMLGEYVHKFAAYQGATVPPQWLHSQRIQPWLCDLGPLRDRMEERVLKAFWETGNLLVDTQRQAAPELKRMMSEGGSGLAAPSAPGSLLNFNLRPSLTPPDMTVVFDLDDDAWQDVQSAEDAARKIEEIIIAEYGYVADELAASASNDLQTYVSAGIKRFFERCMQTLEQAIAHEEKAIARANERALAARKAPGGDALADPAEKLARARERLAEGERIIGLLKECMERQSRLTA